MRAIAFAFVILLAGCDSSPDVAPRFVIGDRVLVQGRSDKQIGAVTDVYAGHLDGECVWMCRVFVNGKFANLPADDLGMALPMAATVMEKRAELAHQMDP